MIAPQKDSLINLGFMILLCWSLFFLIGGLEKSYEYYIIVFWQIFTSSMLLVFIKKEVAKFGDKVTELYVSPLKSFFKKEEKDKK